MSCATWQSGDDIHDLSCCYLWCWWPLFSEYCIRPRIVFHIITSEYNSTFVFLVLRLQFGNLKMTDVHQWGEMNFCALRPCFIDHLWFVSDFCYVPRRNLFSNFSHSLSTAAFAAGIFIASGTGINLCTKLLCCSELSPLPAKWSSWWFGKSSPIRSLVDSLASKIHASFVFNFVGFTTCHHMLTVLACLAKHGGSH